MGSGGEWSGVEEGEGGRIGDPCCISALQCPLSFEIKQSNG